VAQILSAANVKKSSENYLSFCGTKTFCSKHKKKPMKTTLVSVARGGPPKITEKNRYLKKTAENNFSFGGFDLSHRKYIQPPKTIDFL
jgi:hypothetical protein